MTIENPCEFIKKIRENPFVRIEDISFKDLKSLQDHLTMCDTCARVVDEVLEEYKDVPTDPNINDGRWN
jgi:hypothetical protein